MNNAIIYFVVFVIIRSVIAIMQESYKIMNSMDHKNASKESNEKEK